MAGIENYRRTPEDIPIIPTDPEITPYPEEEEEDEEWGKLAEVAGAFQAIKVQVATEEQNQKAKRYFDKRDKLVEGCPSSSLSVYDPSIYMDDYNKVIRDNHVLPSKVESLMISLRPILEKPQGKKLLDALEKKMHGAKLCLAKMMRKI